MAVDSYDPARARMVPTWVRCRTAHEGGDAVREFDLRQAGTGLRLVGDVADRWFLPPRPKMRWRQYRDLLRCALWSGITRRTVDGMVGVLFREAPANTLPAALAADVTGTGRTAAQFAQDVARELMLTGQCVVLADIPPGLTRARLSILPAENVLDVRYEDTDDGRVPVLVKVWGYRYQPGEDEWETDIVEQVHVLRADARKRYRVELYERPVDRHIGPVLPTPDPNVGSVGTGGEWKPKGSRDVVIRGGALDDLPIVVSRIEDADEGEPQPPISGVVDLNIDHYRMRAAQAYALHTVLPTLVITGSKVEKAELDRLELGVQSVLGFPGEAAKAQFVGLGADLTSLENRIQNTETLIARMGARMLMGEPKAGVEAAETVRLRQTGEAAAMVQLADAVDRTMTRALGRLAALDGRGGKPKFEVDRTTLAVDPARVEKLMELYDANLLPRVVVLKELQRMHALPDDLDPEEIDEQIRANAPTAPVIGSGEDDDEAGDGGAGRGSGEPDDADE